MAHVEAFTKQLSNTPSPQVMEFPINSKHRLGVFNIVVLVPETEKPKNS